MKYAQIIFCAFWLTTQQASELAYSSPSLWSKIQDCTAKHRDEWHYTDKCISKAFPNKTLLVDQECARGFDGQSGGDYFCRSSYKLIRDGQFVYN